jgi:hypothetical protein
MTGGTDRPVVTGSIRFRRIRPASDVFLYFLKLFGIHGIWPPSGETAIPPCMHLQLELG